jgi:Family of unknown function (DUF6308)
MEERELQSPLPWLVGNARGQAIRHLYEYMTLYTGRFFEKFAERSDDDRFEADDIVAVSCLGVNVPEAVSAWLLLGEGQERSETLLAQLGSRSVALTEFDLASNAAALDLWQLLGDQRDMGPTTVSKLMAAKRPHLVPIYDAYVADALLSPSTGRSTWWEPWQALLQGSEGPELVNAAEEVRAGAKAIGADVTHLSILRIIDIVVWRSEEVRRRERFG